MPTVSILGLSEMLPSIPTFASCTTGSKPIVTAGMVPVASGVTLLPLASFRNPPLVPRVEPSVVTQGLVTATHTVPSVPASLVHTLKLGLVPPRLCNVESVMNVSSGTTVCEAVCSVPTT